MESRTLLAMAERVITPILLVTAIVLAGKILGGPQRAATETSLDRDLEALVGSRGPQFTVRSLSGDTAILPFPNSKSLLVFLRSGCRFCTESFPAYRQLAELRCDLPIAFFSDDSIPALSRFWADYGFERPDSCAPAVIGSLQPDQGREVRRSYHLQGTPIHLLTAEDRTILDVHLGTLTKGEVFVFTGGGK